MNSEHKSQNLQNIVKKYNIKKYERIDRCRYKLEIFNSVIIKDIYNLSKTLEKYENVKKRNIQRKWNIIRYIYK